jgi:hypothetical protein
LEVIESTQVSDDDYVLRRIPDHSYYKGSPSKPKITRGNFELRESETGISVNLERLMSVEELLKHRTARDNDVAARAKVGEIVALGLQVIPVYEHDNPGHCEIRDGIKKLADEEIRNSLKKIFSFT